MTGSPDVVERPLGRAASLGVQLQWVVASIAFMAVAIVFGFVLGTVVPSASTSGIAWIPAVVAYPTVPISIGVAVLRYRLFDIDRVVNRSISYALVTTVLASVFVATNMGLQAVASGATGGGTIAVASSTLLVAALFQPLRRLVQAPVDRRFNRARIDAERSHAASAERTREEVDLARLIIETGRVVGDAVQPAAGGVWLRRAVR